MRSFTVVLDEAELALLLQILMNCKDVVAQSDKVSDAEKAYLTGGAQDVIQWIQERTGYELPDDVE